MVYTKIAIEATQTIVKTTTKQHEQRRSYTNIAAKIDEYDKDDDNKNFDE
jgi:hypothetical protein